LYSDSEVENQPQQPGLLTVINDHNNFDSPTGYLIPHQTSQIITRLSTLHFEKCEESGLN
jgi:hypothetical protein